MKWRRVPPVYSPVAPASLIRGVSAALHLAPSPREAIAERLKGALGADDVVLTDSGTSALVLALRATVSPGSVVALPAYGCIDLIAAAIRARVRVTLYDVDPTTLSPRLDSVRACLSLGAAALVVAPLYGYPPDMKQLAAIASEQGVPLIEDAAQGAGGTFDGRRLGAFGGLTVLSFGRGKGTTAGAGGALLIRDSRFQESLREARLAMRAPARGTREVAVLAAQMILARPSLYAIPAYIPALKLGEMVYHPAPEPGSLSDAAAGVLSSALALDDRELEVRRSHATTLMAAISSARRFAPIRALNGARPGYLRLAIMDVSGSASTQPQLGMLRGYPVTLDAHPATRSILDERVSDLRGAAALRDRLFTLPTHSRVTALDLERLTQWLGENPEGGALRNRPNEAG